MIALLYYIPDRRIKGSPPLPYENQEEHEEKKTLTSLVCHFFMSQKLYSLPRNGYT